MFVVLPDAYDSFHRSRTSGCPKPPMTSSHLSTLPILSGLLASPLDSIADPDWESLSPPEQTTIQLRLEQALSSLRQALDTTYLHTDPQAIDRVDRLLETFLTQIQQNLGQSQFTIVPTTPDRLLEFSDRQAYQLPTAWPLGNSALGNGAGWLLRTTDYPPGWLQLIQPIFVERAIGQLNTVLRSVELWQQAPTQQIQTLQQQNRELAQVSKLKSEFLANTSHEIRTPLSSILGFTHLLREQGFTPDSERHQEYLRIILTSGQHLLALINDILDLSKIEANQMDLEWSETELAPLCKTVLTLVKEKANDKGLALRLDRPEACDRMQVDPLRLKQMLFNLMSNAIKFTDAGSIGLRLQPDGQYLRFTVWDTGAGIAPEQQALLFRAYSQLPQDEENRGIGTGLGLALTQKLAELHGGWVEVASTVGEGSAFTIVLPIAPATAIVPPDQQLPIELAVAPIIPVTPIVPPAAIPASKKFRKAERNYHLLLVEDHPPNARLMITYLCKLGYEVTWAKDSQMMWRSLEQSLPAMILLDINLPDVDGLTLTKQLREHQRYQNLPIIAQTAMAMTGDREICMAAGVDEYITKPIDLTKLADVIRQYSDPGRG
jgi:signal transduction histidine kinase/ActR/RegA family two-component response regulator